MADTAAPVQAKAKTPKKKPAAKKPALHPKYSAMIKAAIVAIKDRQGASTAAIRNYINKNYKVDEAKNKVQVRKALKKGVDDGSLKRKKGVGAQGRFVLGDKAEKAKKPKGTKKAKKPKAAKPKTAKKPAAKKVKKPKAATKKSPKKAKTAKPKTVKKSPKKTKAAKPKKAKTPKKKATTKKAAK